MLSNSDKTYDFIKNKICPYCQSKIKKGADFIVCPNCGTPHHSECWNENLGCTTYGCINNPITDKKIDVDSVNVGNETIESLRASLQVPQTRNLTDCPNCKSQIETGSTYCKFCGFNIAENKFPEESKTEAKKEFENEFKKRYKDKISITRKRLLITIGSFTVLAAALIYLFFVSVNKLNEHFSSDDYKIKSMVYNWKEAWESKDLEKYKSNLTEDYTYYGKDGKKIELKERLRRMGNTFKNYETINIEFTDFKFINDSTTIENDRKVQFMEDYKSEKYKESGLKTLRVYKGDETNGEWKIYREIFE